MFVDLAKIFLFKLYNDLLTYTKEMYYGITNITY